MDDVLRILEAARLAAERHRDQRRKGASQAPYVNHPIEVAEVLARIGGVRDAEVLVAALLHDIVEDTGTRPEEIEEIFDATVRRLVEEVTDDKSLPKEERKRRQVEHAPRMSRGAKLIKLGDKICNVREIALDPPADWPSERKREYFDWAEAVVAGLGGTNESLEREFGAVVGLARSLVDQTPFEEAEVAGADPIAHLAENGRRQALIDHLRGTSALAADFAAAFGAKDWGYCAGLWHDLGKYSTDFQDYIRSGQGDSAESATGRVDHSTAGAIHGVAAMPLLGHLIAYPIAGHHAGLLDGRSENACQDARLRKDVPLWSQGLKEIDSVSPPETPEYLRKSLGRKDAFAVSFFTRMLFSCLVDADFLDTEAFMDPARGAARGGYRRLGDLLAPFAGSLDDVERCAPNTEVSLRRREVRAACERAACQEPGFFSLTVPTGGGKTLSSLAFALGHAVRYGLRRVIYVAPFTSIIEQNAEVLRRHLGEGVVLEHHSGIEPSAQTNASRLAAENWDAPVIVTTAVQFYESLFANRTSACRKLHRIARSVVILDEAQTLPVDLLAPCLRALKELRSNYGVSVVLCTATQPEIEKREEFGIGLEGVREIVPDPASLYESLRRVEMKSLGVVPDANIGERLLSEKQVLCIVNTTKHARHLFEEMGAVDGHFHLSARMCPAHRSAVLARVRERLSAAEACRLVSTQVVEAGVDIDFPVVYRALAGLDSLAQAAGRCNRNGLLPDRGRVFVFQTEHTAANRYFADTAQCAAQVMELHGDDPLTLKAIEMFFKLYYWDQRGRWDAKRILDRFRLLPNDPAFPFDFDFATASRDFRMIDDGARYSVVVPWGDRGKAIAARLRAMGEPTREVLREAQRFIVQVRQREWLPHAGRSIKMIYDNFGILESPETHYSETTGLNLEAEGPGIYWH